MIDQEKNSAVHPYELIHELLFQVACKNRPLTQKLTPRDTSAPILSDPQSSQITILGQPLGLIAMETQPPPSKNAIYNLKYNFYTLPGLQKVKEKKAYLLNRISQS